MKTLEWILLSFCVLISFQSCFVQPESNLSVSYHNQDYSLQALNTNALSNRIKDLETSKYAFYGFQKNFIQLISTVSKEFIPAIQITISIPKDVRIINSDVNDLNFAFGLLSQDDFNKNHLKSELTKSNMIYGKRRNVLTDKNSSVSFSILLNEMQIQKIKGFVLYSEFDVEILNVELVPAMLGFKYDDVNLFCFSENGGMIPQNVEHALSTEWNFSNISYETLVNYPNLKIYVNNIIIPYEQKIDKKVEKDNKIMVQINNSVFTILPYVNSRIVSINTAQLQEPIMQIKWLNNIDNVTGLLYEDFNKKQNNMYNPIHKILPIKTDPGLIRTWNRNNWRSKDFEIFSWEEFPSILIIDFSSYLIQDAFLKRLAFYTEKKGFVGILMTDDQIKNLHAYNAHDYKAESLASFFNQANEENFKLNDSELLLRQILLEHGIIVLQKNKIRPGKGALISISQESANYLRNTFLCHEGLHGVYFINEEFRNVVKNIYSTTDNKSIEFLQNYFSATDSLNYDIEDSYLMQNEFMAYLLQQGLSFTQSYFTQNLANRKQINKKHPESVQYIKQTDAQGLLESAKRLDEFVYSNYGMNAGREWLVLREDL